ncbi:hypothetical protein BGX26_011155, partial [Mortierella sp. AD094]
MTNVACPTFVGFMDNKLDDKVAFWYLFQYGGYRQHIVVLSGVHDMQAACGDFRDFLRNMVEINKFTSNTRINEIVVLEGNRVETPVPHESTFIGTPMPTNGEFEENTIKQLLNAGGPVDILQCAPTPKKYIVDMINVPSIAINKYHLIHGYNSYQESPREEGKKINSDDQTTFEWLQSIQSTIRVAHGQADIRFTNNYTSFVARSGALQPYTELKTLLPALHLDAALRDPFVNRQLSLSYKILLDAVKCGIISADDLDEISLVPAGCKMDELPNLTLEARKNDTPLGKEYRVHFLDLVAKIPPKLQIVGAHYARLAADQKNNADSAKYSNICRNIANRKQRIENGVKDAFTKPLSVELCDANHVLAVMASDGILDGR